MKLQPMEEKLRRSAPLPTVPWSSTRTGMGRKAQ
ncbi:hypothetical protein LEMLEM_LOCUS24494 [Lemmus lemmus]